MSRFVLVTGSSRGIGKTTAIEFDKRGYDVAINYLTEKENAERLQEYIQCLNL